MATYERVLADLIADDPDDSLVFHHLMDAPPDKAERGTAEILAIHYSTVIDRARGDFWPQDDDWDEIAKRTEAIYRWRDQIIGQWRELDRVDELRTMPYRQYLRTPEWQSRRRVALVAASHRCEVCNASDHLEVHHRDYERRGAELESDLTVLCSSCHGLFHEHRGLS